MATCLACRRSQPIDLLSLPALYSLSSVLHILQLISSYESLLTPLVIAFLFQTKTLWIESQCQYGSISYKPPDNTVEFF
jgi:hypothetical protein